MMVPCGKTAPAPGVILSDSSGTFSAEFVGLPVADCSNINLVNNWMVVDIP